MIGEPSRYATVDFWRRAMAKPSKKELSQAGKDLRNPRASEKRETEASKTLREGQKKK
jgi:hypothetical protein